MSLKLTVMAISVLIAAPVAAYATSPSDVTQIAHRLLEDQLGSSDYVAAYDQQALAGFDRMAAQYHIPAASARRAALLEALTESASDISQSEDQLADIYATTLTSEELSVWVAFMESPQGKSIEAKKRQVGWPMTQPDLTVDEVKAQSAFNASPEGVAIMNKNPQLIGKSVQVSGSLNAKIGLLEQQIYCKTASCAASSQTSSQ